MSRSRRGRGEGSIFKRNDGHWVGNVSLGHDGDGKRVRRVVYGGTKQEVQKKLRELQAKASVGHLSDADRLTVKDYLTLWLESVRPKLAPSTFDRYKLVVDRQLCPYLGHLRMSKLQTFHVSQLYSNLEQQGESPRSRQMSGTVLHTALRAAVRRKLLTSNPCTDAERPSVPHREMQVWTPGQVQMFLDAVRADRLSAMYTLAIDSGVRQGELFGLHWPDVDFEAGSVSIQRTLEEIRGQFRLKEPKTAKSRRRIELSRFTLNALHEHRKSMLAEGRDVRAGLVFCDQAGGFLRKSNVSRRSFQATIRRINSKATEKLPQIRFHDLRHCAATLLLMAGESVKVVSERLGHAKIELTLNTYSHVLPTMQKAAAEKMHRILAAGNG